MSHTNVRFIKTSKLLWHAYAAILVLVLVLPKTSGAQNTAYGLWALASDTSGNDNSAFGFDALASNVDGNDNTAIGGKALYNNTTSYNTATGYGALYSNTGGQANTANGFKALLSNSTGGVNTAEGYEALYSNTVGYQNTAVGNGALFNNTIGAGNTAAGAYALQDNTTGTGNIALGVAAGTYLTTGDNNIDIGNSGAAGDIGNIKIGAQGTQTATYIAGIYGATVAGGVEVVVDASGQLGVKTSSARFKEAIKPMDEASEAILALKPVTFRYKKELDPQGVPQFGLVAEQVEKVDPDLVVRDEKGQILTVRYEAVNAMLLNEFLKEHQRVQELQARVDEMVAQMKEQARVVEEVSNKIEAKELSRVQLATYQVIPSEMNIK